MASWSVLYYLSLPDTARIGQSNRGASPHHFMRTLASTSRRAYSTTLLSRIARKRQAIQRAIVDNATKDLYIARSAEISQRGIGYHVKYIWS